MGAERVTLDSNVLVYAVDRDAGERHEQAVEIVDRCVDLSCALSLQVLGEFYFVATRKGRMPHHEAAAQVADWQILFPTLVPTPRTIGRALDAVSGFGLPFWDAMLWAVCAENGITLLYSEDFQHERVYGTVRARNPFLPVDTD